MNIAHAVDNPLIYKDFNHIGSVFSDPRTPMVMTQHRPEGWSAGWRWHPSRQFDPGSVATVARKAWIGSVQSWLFMVVRRAGFRTILWITRSRNGDRSEWRKDSRLGN